MAPPVHHLPNQNFHRSPILCKPNDSLVSPTNKLARITETVSPRAQRNFLPRDSSFRAARPPLARAHANEPSAEARPAWVRRRGPARESSRRILTHFRSRLDWPAAGGLFGRYDLGDSAPPCSFARLEVGFTFGSVRSRCSPR